MDIHDKGIARRAVLKAAAAGFGLGAPGLPPGGTLAKVAAARYRLR